MEVSYDWNVLSSQEDFEEYLSDMGSDVEDADLTEIEVPTEYPCLAKYVYSPGVDQVTVVYVYREDAEILLRKY